MASSAGLRHPNLTSCMARIFAPKIPVKISQIGGSFKNLKKRFGKIWPILIHRVILCWLGLFRVFFDDAFAWSLGKKNKSLQSHLENDCQLSYRQSPDLFRHRWHRPLRTSLVLPCFQGSSRRRCQLGIQSPSKRKATENSLVSQAVRLNMIQAKDIIIT